MSDSRIWCVGVAVVCCLTGMVGAQALVPPDITAASSTDKLIGAPHQHLGITLTSGGDWNGDGRDDVAGVGVTPNTINTAEVRIFVDLDEPGTTNGVFTVQGLPSKYWGIPVALVKDLDGRGMADLVIGLPEWPFTATTVGNTGAVAIYFGENWSSTPGPVGLDSADILITASVQGIRFGWSVADAGDVDGDGLCELLVGAPGCDASDSMPGGSGACDGAPANFAGKAYLYYGSPSGMAFVDGIPATPAPPGPVLGTSGLPLGISPNPGLMVVDPPIARLVLNGESPHDRYGFSVAGLGDLNGDGRAEYAVGAIQAHRSRALTFTPFQDGAGNDLRGYVDIFSLNASNRIARITPNTSGTDKVATVFGISVSAMGDVDGDQVRDVIVGAPGTYQFVLSQPDTPRGAVFVYSGAAVYANAAVTHISSTLQLFDPLPGTLPQQYEIDSGAELGYSVAGASVSIDSDPLESPDLVAGGWHHNAQFGLVLVLTPSLLNPSQLTILKRIGGVSAGINDHPRFGSGVSLGRVYAPGELAVIVGASGQGVEVTNPQEQGHIHVFDAATLFP